MNRRMFLFLVVAFLPMGILGQEEGVSDLAADAIESVKEVKKVLSGDAEKEVGNQEEEEIEKAKTNHQLLGKAVEESFEGKVVVVTVGEKDLMSGQSFKFWRKVMRRVDEEGGKAIVFELDTPGGLAFETMEIITEEMRGMKAKTIAFVNPNAISAGALISIGTDSIYMAENAVIGSAGVINGSGQEMDPVMRKKVESLLDAYVRTTVKKRGHRLDVVRAMMFADDEEEKEFGEIKLGKGNLLTLTADEAASIVDGEPLLAKGIVGSIEQILEKEGLSGAEIVRAEPSGFEKVAWWVGMISPVLILVGLGGGYLEMKSPGFGVGGVISLVAFSLFFFGNYAAGNLAGYEVAAVFVIGIVLILVEVFFLPGFIIPGLLGLACIVGAMFFAMVDEFAIEDFRRADFEWGSFSKFFGGAMWRLAVGFLGSLVLFSLMMKYLQKLPFFNRMVLNEELVTAEGLAVEPRELGAMIGQEGIAVTDLRPAGKVEIGGVLLDVTVGEGFVAKGNQVKIVKEELMRVVVEKV